MARGQSTKNRLVVNSAWEVMDKFKYDIAKNIGLQAQVQDGYWGEIPSRDCGAVGGHMVKQMIRLAEEQLAQHGTLPRPGAGGFAR